MRPTSKLKLMNNKRIQTVIDGNYLNIEFVTMDTVKLSYGKKKPYINPCLENEFISLESAEMTETPELISVSCHDLTISIDQQSHRITCENQHQSIHVLEYLMIDKRINGDPAIGSKVTFKSDSDESFYGLGQHQNNLLDYRGCSVEVWHNYKAKGGETIGIPFLISSKGYGVIMNTLSQSTVTAGVNGRTTWLSDCVEDVSFYLIMPKDYGGLYKSYRQLTGITPMPLKASLGYIQCKQRYVNQAEIEAVAKTYKNKDYPIDMLVVDWFYWKVLGDMSMDPIDWPDPLKMTTDFLSMGIDTMISVWPRFMKESTHYDFLETKRWLMQDGEGRTLYGTAEDQRGALIDTTNIECGQWYWACIRDNFGSKGFKAWWTDENEPDLWPYDYNLSAGKGYEVFNLYPYTHTKAIYEGHRKDYTERCCILSRSAYLGNQKFGTQFWSSDVYPTWGVLEKQVPTMINFCASGLGYWSSDIGGWQALPDYDGRSEAGVEELLLETQGPSTGVVNSDNYPELYIRWFQFSVFSPILRAHGTRDENEVWSFGREAEKILVTCLSMRYALMPYIYSLSYQMFSEGMPMVRGLFMTHSEDEKCKTIKDAYMFGDRLLIAPIVLQGQRLKKVYLPEGDGWYDYWDHTYYEGGQTIEVSVTLDKIPIYVKNNSLLPIGSPVSNTKEVQEIQWRFYGKGDGDFLLYQDDGRTYGYEEGDFKLSHYVYQKGQLLLDHKNISPSVLVENIY